MALVHGQGDDAPDDEVIIAKDAALRAHSGQEKFAWHRYEQLQRCAPGTSFGCATVRLGTLLDLGWIFCQETSRDNLVVGSIVTFAMGKSPMSMERWVVWKVPYPPPNACRPDLSCASRRSELNLGLQGFRLAGQRVRKPQVRGQDDKLVIPTAHLRRIKFVTRSTDISLLQAPFLAKLTKIFGSPKGSKPCSGLHCE